MGLGDRRRTRGALALLFALALAGCATLEHGMSVSQVAGRTLSTRGAEGAERLRAELEVDVTLRDFVERYGRPDYLHVVDRMSLYFFYVKDDMAAKFERDLLPPSVARKLDPLCSVIACSIRSRIRSIRSGGSSIARGEPDCSPHRSSEPSLSDPSACR